MTTPECTCGCLETITEFPDCSKDRAKIKLRLDKAHFRAGDSKWRNLCWQKHRERVNDAKAVVDTKSPRFPPFIFIRRNSVYNRRLASAARIERENVFLTLNIKKAFVDDTGTPSYIKCNQLNWYAVQENWMELMSKFPLYWRNVTCKPYESVALEKAQDGTKPQVYFDLEVKDRDTIGRIVIELDPMAGPVAAEQFLVMFIGKYKKYKYKCSQMNKLWPGLGWVFAQGTNSIVKCPLSPKKYRMKHDQKGIVSLVNNGHDLFGAEFFITARELKPLDDQYLAIGRVLEGMEFLESVQNIYAKTLSEHIRKGGYSMQKPVYIVRTGEFDPDNPPLAPEITRKCPPDPHSKSKSNKPDNNSENRDHNSLNTDAEEMGKGESDSFENQPLRRMENDDEFKKIMMPITYFDDRPD